jgi:hypothetical protein
MLRKCSFLRTRLNGLHICGGGLVSDNLAQMAESFVLVRELLGGAPVFLNRAQRLTAILNTTFAFIESESREPLLRASFTFPQARG